MSNSLDRFRIKKLEGRPLLLPIEEQMRSMKDYELLKAMKDIKRIFKNKPELRDACIEQLQTSIKSSKSTLNTSYIENYILKGNKINVLVTWNGSSDKIILNRLGITQFQVLNITCYDKYFDQNFFLKLEKFGNKQIIFETEIGTFNKNGRLLNLEETHRMVCSRKHKTDSLHDPRTDVKLTKCIFDYIVRIFGYQNLTKHYE
ncbi:Uncharacterized protein FWK35_00014957 [Aphis craccivora]|uniref:Uncharacterized protein n=1 Tax=Aphis craccivora TaxID=307492 RepID=A0A6G0YL99_APHCR|nr:Uncharacterized protein FWK35_00014957 [Aphis craccivora]